jgi:hypothetical protein
MIAPFVIDVEALCCAEISFSSSTKCKKDSRADRQMISCSKSQAAQLPNRAKSVDYVLSKESGKGIEVGFRNGRLR